MEREIMNISQSDGPRLLGWLADRTAGGLQPRKKHFVGVGPPTRLPFSANRHCLLPPRSPRREEPCLRHRRMDRTNTYMCSSADYTQGRPKESGQVGDVPVRSDDDFHGLKASPT